MQVGAGVAAIVINPNGQLLVLQRSGGDVTPEQLLAIVQAGAVSNDYEIVLAAPLSVASPWNRRRSMCEKCDRMDELIAEVNAGKRTFDREVLRTLLEQDAKVVKEMLDDCDSDKPLHELLSECAETMVGISLASFHNAKMVKQAAEREVTRLVTVATQAEKERG